MSTTISDRCRLCGGAMEAGFTTFAADIRGRLFVARRVPALLCEQCGEEWISDETARELERLAALGDGRDEVEIVSLAA